jgi:hypothetical protein
MTRWEILAWVGSEDSRGWLVKAYEGGPWMAPQFFEYRDDHLPKYQRAKLRPDLLMIDESTIQGFEVEMERDDEI